jgi:spoIIIJ-associated protein
MSERDEPGSQTDAGEDVEATGETVGEAKWAALRELERRFPGIDKAAVRFTVVSEGERGILGVGYAPARVVARTPSAGTPASRPTAAATPYVPGSSLARVHDVLARICAGLKVSAAIDVVERGEELAARLSGPDLGLLIGKHGQTIDAIQYLVNAIVWRGDEPRREVVVDAAGYRARRTASLERLADRAASEALESGRAVPLDAMTAAERKIVHLRLRERSDVETTSEGTEPNRRVVVMPTRAG